MLFIPGPVQQDNIALPRFGDDLIDQLSLLVEFLKEPLPELISFTGVVSEPFSQFGAWRYIL
jgi:hypothetical protein